MYELVKSPAKNSRRKLIIIGDCAIIELAVLKTAHFLSEEDVALFIDDQKWKNDSIGRLPFPITLTSLKTAPFSLF